jgi:hypothetical protein
VPADDYEFVGGSDAATSTARRIMSALSFRHRLSLVTLATGMALAACGHHGAGNEPPRTPGARADSVEAAVADIVNARCDLEDRCGTIAPGQKFDSRAICESKMQGSTASELNTKDCPLGVEGYKLDTCLANIRSESCESMFDSLNRWNACRNGQICFK